MIGNMTERIGKCIVHNDIVYDYKTNKSAFANRSDSVPKWEKNNGLHVVCNNPDSIYIYMQNTNDIYQVKLKDCLFIFEDDIGNYPEYFI
jgi:hypothetical protein